MKIYRGVDAHDRKKNNISWNPTQRKSIPQRADWKITVSHLIDISIATVDECQGSHDDGKEDPEHVREVPIWVQASFSARSLRFENVKCRMNCDH